MQTENELFSSGLASLDRILDSIHPGDNIVWEVENIEHALPVIIPYYQYANKCGKKLIYFRFSAHSPLVPDDVEAERYELDPQEGFEPFISKILSVIEEKGKGAYYIFDCLSDLAVDWYSDRMLGNFFMITCPYLYIYETVTYFVLLKDSHTSVAINAIHNTAQVVLEVYRSEKRFYLLPLKVWKRHSPTMYMLHRWENNEFYPIKNSAEVSKILSRVPQPWIDYDIHRQDTWTKVFIQAQTTDVNVCSVGLPASGAKHNPLKKQLIKMMLTREEKLYDLCNKYFDICDLISIGKRMIGTGLIGGKSVGMLLSRAIIQKEDSKWNDILETHDSFFLGSDVFYTYVIQNDCWWSKHKIKHSENLFVDSKILREKLVNGKFPRDIIEQFKEMLNYFGQSPIIVRSSSLLEDAYGNAFSGKYESVFCANQGTPQERLDNFMDAIRTVYASTMGEDALAYRSHRGLLEREEQMALLIQRVSGAFYNNLYFPQMAGVGYSFNPFVWNNQIDPKKGVLRIVFGLGTRAVDRHDEDYTRIVALNAPMLRPEGSFDEVRKYAQRIMDVLNLEENSQVSVSFEDVVKNIDDIPMDIFATKDKEIENKARALKIKNVFPWVLTFEKLLTKTPFVQEMDQMLHTIEKAYAQPVDIEFALNFFDEDNYRINLLQCRPFQIGMEAKKIKPPKNLQDKDIILKTTGPIIGQSVSETIDRIVYVLPSKYGQMSMSERYSVARLVGELTNTKEKDKKIMLIGPGRWGTKMPALGIPVSFSEIKNASALCELAEMHENLTPDISLGTHFFNDLVEMNILYMALFPGKEGHLINEALIRQAPNKLEQLIPRAKQFFDSVHVIDTKDITAKETVTMYINTINQEGIVFSSKK